MAAWAEGGALTSQVDLSEPRYAEKAFCPQGHCMGLQMGAKADTACRRHMSEDTVDQDPEDGDVSRSFRRRTLYFPGFFRAQISAPWPPMECPLMDILSGSVGKLALISLGSWETDWD